MLPLLLALALSTLVENQKPGTPDWDLTDPAVAREIEGYASKTSVNGGEPIDLFVHTTAARYTIDVFRTGLVRRRRRAPRRRPDRAAPGSRRTCRRPIRRPA